MTPEDFHFIADLVKRESGILLKDDKGYLVESRLLPVAQKHSLDDLSCLTKALRMRGTGGLAGDVVEALTTNETFFFRDGYPFELFRTKVLPRLQETRRDRKTIRIWCAAASTGQEPYSLAMVLKEHFTGWAGWRFEIIATDIAPKVLEKAKSGRYTQFEVQRGLPVQLLLKYFTKDGDSWVIDPALRAMVQYRQHNILADPTVLGRFDVVFCRNILIYFDVETKKKIFDRIGRLMADDGALFLGGAETVLGVTDVFTPTPGERGVYGLKDPDRERSLLRPQVIQQRSYQCLST